MNKYKQELMKVLDREPTDKEYIDYLETKVDNLTNLVNMIGTKE